MKTTNHRSGASLPWCQSHCVHMQASLCWSNLAHSIAVETRPSDSGKFPLHCCQTAFTQAKQRKTEEGKSYKKGICSVGLLCTSESCSSCIRLCCSCEHLCLMQVLVCGWKRHEGMTEAQQGRKGSCCRSNFHQIPSIHQT